MDSSSASVRFGVKQALFAFLILIAVLAFLFWQSFVSNLTLFANDGPLGAANATFAALPAIFTGAWGDLIWIGYNAGSASPMPTNVIRMVLGAIDYSKFYSPLSLLILGLCAFYFFRVLTKNMAISVLGALAAMLNMNFFSNVCWGLGTRATSLGMIFLALGLVLQSEKALRWPRLILAGLFVGMAVLEGADNGAIFSLFVAAFVVVRAVLTRESAVAGALRGFGRLAIVTFFAGLMAAQAFAYLIPTQLVGATGGGPDSPQKALEKWNFATQWSLPKIEILRTLIPGIFGYRVDSPDGARYWGAVGRDPGWEPKSGRLARHSGAGEYAGVLVVTIALWAVARSLAKRKPGDDEVERRTIWFWAVCAVISVLFAFGRHAPFYRIIYSMPYFSSIRNPIKFMHAFHLCAMVLFGYGLLDLYRTFILNQKLPSLGLGESLAATFKKAGSFERKWMLGSIVAMVASGLAFLIYAASKSDLVKYMTANDIPATDATAIASFSQTEFLLFLVFLAASLALTSSIAAGAFAGRRGKWAGVLLGVVLVLDLARSDRPWIQYYDYKDKYASNALFEELRDHSFEHRVTARVTPFMPGSTIAGGQLRDLWYQVYNDWIQHPFQYYDIQSIDFAQMPRTPFMDTNYSSSFFPHNETDMASFGRLWQLTNTRYILGMAGFLGDLNARFDPQGHRFVIKRLFTLANDKSGLPLVAQTNSEGPLALFEFTGALPRAKLYSQWQITTNETETLQQLANPAFDPAKSAFVFGDTNTVGGRLGGSLPPSLTASYGGQAALPGGAAGSNGVEGTVEWVSYAPKKIVLKTKAEARSLLLLNDRHDPDWVVRVDGARVPLLRCNYIMRGAMIEPGSHDVVFSYEPAMTGLHISLAAIAIGVVLCGFLAVKKKDEL